MVTIGLDIISARAVVVSQIHFCQLLAFPEDISIFSDHNRDAPQKYCGPLGTENLGLGGPLKFSGPLILLDGSL